MSLLSFLSGSKRKLFSLFFYTGFVVCVNLTTLHAEPGMWTFDGLPVDLIQKKYGFRPSEQLIDQMKYSMARISSGGSGSFVSANGLLITNHHVAQSGLAQISTKEKNYEREGFIARSQEEEIRIPSYEVNAFLGVDDVTKKVLSAVKEGMSDYEGKKARDRVIAEIEETYFKETGAKPQVISLFRGTTYHLYKFKRYRDVRLVWAPEKQAGFFGDDEANFHYPRYNLDVALLRVYGEDAKPIESPYYLPISPFGSSENELLFVAGNPGSTKRHFSSAELSFERDALVPFYLSVLEDQERAMMEHRKKGAEAARLATSALFSIQNSLKVYRGMSTNLSENRVVEKKADWESSIANRLGTSEKNAAWTESLKKIEVAQASYREMFEKLILTSGRFALNSLYLQYALDIVAISEEVAKDSLDREARYRPSNRPSLDLQLASSQPIYPAFEQAKLTQSLSWAQKRFGENDPLIILILAGKSVVDRAAELSQSEILKDPAKRVALFKQVEAGTIKLSEINDPWISLASSVRKFRLSLEEQVENQVSGPTSRAFAEQLGLRRSLGEVVYPDATFSPRVCFGVVSGYVDHGMQLPAYTTIGGAFDQAFARDNQGFWELPESWYRALENKQIDRSTPLNFVAKLDTIGGNSGSPAINRYGQWVGILFDGNRFASGQVTHSEPNEKVGRSILVDSRAVISSLKGVYEAGYFLDEINQAWDMRKKINSSQQTMP